MNNNNQANKELIIDKKKKEKEFLQVNGRVIAILGNSVFRVKCDNGKIIIARIASEFRSRKQKGRSSKIIEGSVIRIKLSLNDLEQGRIVSFIDDDNNELLRKN